MERDGGGGDTQRPLSYELYPARLPYRMFTLEINHAGTGGLNHVFKKHTQYVLSHTHMPTGEPCLGHSVGFM